MKARRRFIAGFACTCTALGTVAVSLVLTQPASRSKLPALPAAVTLDPSFGVNGLAKQAGSNTATGVAIAPTGVTGAGDIYVSGGDNTHFQVARFTSSGALDR